PGPFARKPSPRNIHGTVNVTHEERSCCQKVSHKSNTNAKTEALIASVSMVRPWTMTSRVVNQQTAAMVAPVVPRLIRPMVAIASRASRTGIVDGKRALHSLRIPKTRKDPATSQLIKGGLCK